jgi:glycosyltransferase involved in cell wall biosynthesis
MDQYVSVVVPTRNRRHLLTRLLDSLLSIDHPAWDVIVVDDGSTDTTASLVAQYRDRLPIRYLYQPWSKMGAARNRGIAASTAPLIAFTDDDCTVTPSWLTALSAAFSAHPEASGVQGKTVTDHSAMTPFTRQVEQLTGGQPYRTCNIAYRREVLDAAGGFDPNLIRGEDVAMGILALRQGPIVFAPDAVVWHPPRPKEWADRHAWRILLESEMHFRRTYPAFAPQRSQQLSLQKPEHVLSRWVLLPIQRYWRWHWAYFKREPCDYLRHIPLIIREKAALFSLLPFMLRRWQGGTEPRPPQENPPRT